MVPRTNQGLASVRPSGVRPSSCSPSIKSIADPIEQLWLSYFPIPSCSCHFPSDTSQPTLPNLLRSLLRPRTYGQSLQTTNSASSLSPALDSPAPATSSRPTTSPTALYRCCRRKCRWSSRLVPTRSTPTALRAWESPRVQLVASGCSSSSQSRCGYLRTPLTYRTYSSTSAGRVDTTAPPVVDSLFPSRTAELVHSPYSTGADYHR
jgi:hypothetical protein